MKIFGFIDRFFKFLLRLTTGGTLESSKRAMALHSGILLISYIVVFHTTKENAVMMATVITGFALAMAGVTAYEKIKTQDKTKDQELP